MVKKTTSHPSNASPAKWRAARRKLLQEEKKLTRLHDRVAAQRRRLPMKRIEKDYVFEGPTGKRRLRDLFDGRRQLIVYHFMFDPAWKKAAPGAQVMWMPLATCHCCGSATPHFVLISRAPLPQLKAYQKEKGWTQPWLCSFGSDFNYDFHATLDERVRPVEYNYRSKAEMTAAQVPNQTEGESHGLSVFFRLGDEVYHTYFTYARGVESLTNSYSLLDVTPYGRQEDWEDSPPGWPQKPTYG